MQVINDPRNCCIRVSCTADDFAMNDLTLITGIEVYRACTVNNEVSRLIGKIAINAQTEMNFTFADYYTASGVYYEYTCYPVIGGAWGVGCLGGATCQFDGLFIGNLDEQYVCHLSPECSNMLNFNMNYVQTFHATYPHAISNGNLQYYTGSARGIFVEMDDNCNFIIETATAYRRRLEAFLANKKTKVLKTGKGDIWTVQVNGKVQEEETQYQGVGATAFDWTQVGASPNYGIVIVSRESYPDVTESAVCGQVICGAITCGVMTSD